MVCLKNAMAKPVWRTALGPSYVQSFSPQHAIMRVSFSPAPDSVDADCWNHFLLSTKGKRNVVARSLAVWSLGSLVVSRFDGLAVSQVSGLAVWRLGSLAVLRFGSWVF